MRSEKTNTAGHAQTTPDFSPRVYEPSGGWRAFLLIVSVLLGGFSLAGTWYFGTMHEVSSVRQAVWLVGICIMFVLLSSYLLALLFLSRVILTPDSIESRELFSGGKLLRQDILGRRLQENKNSPASLVLVPRDSSTKRLEFATFYNFDETFWEWIDSLPDLDDEDERNAEQEIATNAEIGATPEDRLTAAKNAKRLASLITTVACGIGIWGWFYPRPYRLVMISLLLLPWLALAIVMRSGGLFRIDSRPNDPHPTVAFVFLLPGCVLMLRAVTDVHLLGWKAAVCVSVLVGLALAGMAMIADPTLKTHRGSIVGILFLSLFYGYGAGVQANAIFDRSTERVFTAKVIRKGIVTGKRTTYKLYLAPWGSQIRTDEVFVSQRWYDSLQPGDVVCPVLHDGALHIRWYTVHPCQN